MENSTPEAVAEVLPNPSVEAVEDAAKFAANIVRPEPIDYVAVVDKIEAAQPPKPDFGTLVPVEEVAPLDTATLTKIVASPEIAEALAAEGLEIDQKEVARTIDEQAKRTALETVLSPDASLNDLSRAFVEVTPQRSVELEEPTAEAFRDLKEGINSSFEEVAGILIELSQQIGDIEARLAEHNKRGGHKI